MLKKHYFLKTCRRNSKFPALTIMKTKYGIGLQEKTTWIISQQNQKKKINFYSLFSNRSGLTRRDLR